MQQSGNKSRFYVGKYYEVSDGILGSGSFSKVFLARHRVFGTKVALKFIDRQSIKEDYVLRNLHREAKILRKLNHPNIVNFYEEFSHNELYCLAMEHINGPDLHHYLKKQEYRRVSEKTARVLFYQMVSAVHHMHQSNILHRDLKQENILLECGRVIKIIDFGLSNTYQPKVQLRTHCGSLVYAAPELFQTRSVYGSGVDLWSLGVILYAMVVGCMPFEVSKEVMSSLSDSNKERFLRRISQGLTEENWENMGNLSYDCSNLLENLLQPNQFKRIRIEGVKQHPWFLNDDGLRKRLPQHRMDLKRKFEPEIIDIMADRLHQPKSFLRMHLATRDKYDRVSAMFFILQDTLVKEVLYPPKDLENSLIYQLECRRKSQYSARHDLAEDEQDPECNNDNESSYFSMEHSSRGCSLGENTFVSHNVIQGEPESRENKINFREICSIGDGGHLEKKISERNITRTKPRTARTDNFSLNTKSSIPRRIGDQHLNSTHPAAENRFRSYKNNRPNKVTKDHTIPGRIEEKDGGEKRSGANNYHDGNDNRKNFSNYSNFQIEVKYLKEKFEKGCTIAADKRGYNIKNQQNVSSASNSGYSQPISAKRSTGVDEYTAEQITQIRRRYATRPSINDRPTKPSQTKPIHNNKSCQESITNQSDLFQNQKQAQQMKQRSMIIRRSNASSSLHSGSKMVTNRRQHGHQRTYAPRPKFDSTKNE